MWQLNPFDLPEEKYYETFNECCLMFTLYMMLCFSDMVLDDFSKYQVGYALLILTFVFMAVNLARVVKQSIREAKIILFTYKHRKYFNEKKLI